VRVTVGLLQPFELKLVAATELDVPTEALEILPYSQPIKNNDIKERKNVCL
tara:strand:- start:414 stop:566 length:153 start_codon:yes stop_codon:yes gene_type:complete